MARTLIRGACVLTLGHKTPNFPQADLLIENGLVAEIGEDLRARDAEVIEATDAIVMPGFVDTHRHACISLFRNLGATATAIETTHFQPEDVYAATLVGLLGAVEAGITTVVDWVALPAALEFIEAALQAHADAGLRTVFVHHGADTSPEAIRNSASLIAANLAQGSHTTPALGSSDVTPEHVDQLAVEWATARELGMRIHAHAGLSEAAAGSVAALAHRGLLDSDVTLIHCTHLSDEDLDAVAASGAAIALAPSSEMASGLGAPPLQKFLDRNIEPGLAVDDERLAPGDMFAQMRITNSVQHAAYFDRKLAGKAGLPNLLTTRDVIRYATGVAAKTAGLGDVAGSLEPGKPADLIVLRTDRPNIYPINDPIGAVVWGVDTSNLDWVFVGGKALMTNGELAADVERVRGLAAKAQGRVMAAAGLLAETAAGESS